MHVGNDSELSSNSFHSRIITDDKLSNVASQINDSKFIGVVSRETRAERFDHH